MCATPQSRVQAPQAPQQLNYIPTPLSFLSSFLLPLFLLGGGLVYIHVQVGVCMCVEAGVDLMSSPFAVHLMFLDRLSLIPEFTDSKR